MCVRAAMSKALESGDTDGTLGPKGMWPEDVDYLILQMDISDETASVTQEPISINKYENETMKPCDVAVEMML